MPNIDIRVRDYRFYLRIPFLKRFCANVIETTWGKNHEPSEISLTLSNDAFIKMLNKQHHGKNKPTNVLSFETGMKPQKNVPWLAGDIVMSYDTLLRECREQQKSFREHFAHLLIHGTLHLLGEDHMQNAAATKMEKHETNLMKKLGYNDPYKD